MDGLSDRDDVMVGREVSLGALEPGTIFRLAGRSEHIGLYELLEHGPSSSVVRRVSHAEQIAFVRSDGTPIDFGAQTGPRDYWSPETRVVVR